MNIIAIDCGASFLKGALFHDGSIVKTINKGAPLVHKDEPITNTIQIDSLFEQVKSLLDDFIREIKNDEQIFLSFSNEMHGFILVNSLLKPIIDYISWQKEYGNIEIEGISSKQLLVENNRDDIIASGMPIRAGLPSSNLLYLVRSKVVDVNNTTLLTLGDYLIAKLSNRIPNIHPTNAAATGLFDVTRNEWNYDYINKIKGANNISFPAVGDEPVTFEFSKKTVTCYPALGDQQAALLGSSFVNLNELSFNLGTGAQVSVLTKNPILSNDNSYQIRPYFNGLYLKTVPHIPSGRAMNVYIRFYKSIFEKFNININEADIWEKVLSSDSEGSLAISTSFFENAVENRTTGYIDNIEEYALTFDNLNASILKQLANNFIEISKRISKKEDVKKLVFSGGIARRINKVRELIIDEYKCEYSVAENETLLGINKYFEGKI